MIDIGKALSFPFRDSTWVPKFIIGTLFMILGIVGLGIPVIAGYCVQTTQRVMRREQTVLPEWTDVGVMFVLGFKWCVAYVVYLLPVFIAILPILLLAALGALAENNETLGIFSSVSLVMILFLFVIPYSILLTLLLPIITVEFAKRERISDALDVGRVLSVFRVHWRDAVIIALIGMALTALAGFGFLFFLVGVFFTTFYAYLVLAYMAGSLYQAQIRLEAKA